MTSLDGRVAGRKLKFNYFHFVESSRIFSSELLNDIRNRRPIKLNSCFRWIRR
jgi:hypothetical protein